MDRAIPLQIIGLDRLRRIIGHDDRARLDHNLTGKYKRSISRKGDVSDAKSYPPRVPPLGDIENQGREAPGPDHRDGERKLRINREGGQIASWRSQLRAAEIVAVSRPERRLEDKVAVLDRWPDVSGIASSRIDAVRGHR